MAIWGVAIWCPRNRPPCFMSLVWSLSTLISFMSSLAGPSYFICPLLPATSRPNYPSLASVALSSIPLTPAISFICSFVLLSLKLFFLHSQNHGNTLISVFVPLSRMQPTATRLTQAHSRYREEFEELCELGRGGFGCVHQVRNKLDGRHYAVKKIKFGSIDPEHCLKVILE